MAADGAGAWTEAAAFPGTVGALVGALVGDAV